MNTQDIEGRQQQTDIDTARAKLEEVAATKEARKDPRAGESTMLAQPREKTPTNVEKDIRPVKKKPKKKSFGRELKEAMFSEDIGNGSVTKYIFFRILIPSVKRVLSEMANTAINMALGLDPKTRTLNTTTHTANASVYRDRNYFRNEAPGYGRRNSIIEYEWDEETAKDIFNQIQDLIDRYGECSLMDAYSIMGMGEQVRTTDRNWGWTSMANAEVYPIDIGRERWVVSMPNARPLNR